MANTKEMGYTGLNEWGGWIQEDFLTELRGNAGYKAYNEMRLNSPVIAAMLLSIEQSIRGIDWFFVSDLGDDDPRLELLEASRAGMSHSWNDHIIEAMTMLPFGFSLFEIVYKRVGGQLLWRKFAIRGQDTVHRWLFEDDGGVGGVVQMGAPSYRLIEIPIEKLLLYRTRVEKNNPEGRSILRTAYPSYYFWKHISQTEGIGIERDLAGLPVVKLPEDASTDEDDPDSDASKAAEIVRNIRNDEQAGVVLPYGWDLSLLSTGGTRQFDTDTIIKRYESRMLMSALAQFLVLGQDKVGSLALSSDQTDFYTMSVNATADIVAETFSKYAIPRLLALNGLDPEGIVLDHSPAGDVDLSGLADFLQKTGSMITWLPTDEVWLRSVAKLPDASPEDIEAERERKRAEQQAIFGRLPFGGGDEDDDEDGVEDNNGRDDNEWQLRRARLEAAGRRIAGLPAEPGDDRLLDTAAYAAGRPPDEDERLLEERRLYRLVRAWLRGQVDRVIEGVKENA